MVRASPCAKDGHSCEARVITTVHTAFICIHLMPSPHVPSGSPPLYSPGWGNSEPPPASAGSRSLRGGVPCAPPAKRGSTVSSLTDPHSDTRTGGRSVLCQLAWLIRRDLRCRASMTRRRRSSRIPMSGSPPREPARPATTAPKSPSSLSGASSALGLRSRRERAGGSPGRDTGGRCMGWNGRVRTDDGVPSLAFLPTVSLRALVADDRRVGLAGAWASAVK